MKHTLTIDGREISFEASDADFEAITRIINDITSKDGFVEIDADDVKNILDGAERVFFGEGTSSSEDRCSDAASAAMKDIKDTKRLLISVATGPEIDLMELTMTADAIAQASDPEAEVVWGHVIDEAMNDAVKVSVIAVI